MDGYPVSMDRSMFTLGGRYRTFWGLVADFRLGLGESGSLAHPLENPGHALFRDANRHHGG